MTDDAYFRRLGAALDARGVDVPTVVIDRARLERNRARVSTRLGGRALRLVVKSLPSVPLLRALLPRDTPPRLMCFHRPFLQEVAQAFPDADVLMGKPLPLASLARFYDTPPTSSFRPERQLAWLVDTAERLDALVRFAQERGLALRVAIEIDVGLHRGGVPEPAALSALLERVLAAGEQLQLAAFMGYDAHVAKAPPPSTPGHAARRSDARYAEFLAVARRHLGSRFPETFVCNGAGSPTFALHDSASPIDDVAIGSAFVKPTDFDLPSLSELEPAVFIATRVLKRARGVRIPFLEWLPDTGRDSLFLYGGRWLAEPVWPPSMRPSRLYGPSSNQQLMTVARAARLAVDDFVFFRPTQSEAVLLGFGDLLAWDGDRGLETWSVLG